MASGWGGSSQAAITGNVIRDNDGYGVVLYERPCFERDRVFTGRGNTGTENADVNVCPDALAFPFTDEGGELDQAGVAGRKRSVASAFRPPYVVSTPPR